MTKILADEAARTGKPVLLYVVNVAWFFCLHRLHIARAALAAGFDVHVATAPDFGEDVERIKTEGLNFTNSSYGAVDGAS